jgi:predicted Zn-dependent protease
MTRASYDPTEMTEMFRTLERTGGGSERTPEWLSTHPNPGNRVARTQERIAAWARPAGPLKVNRDPFLNRLDGLVFGDDPRQGYFQQGTFLHPTLKFRLDFPAGWRTQNTAQQVAGISAAQDALLVLSGAGIESPTQALSKFLGQQGIQAGQTSTSAINGLPAAAAQFAAQTEQSVIAGYVAFVQLDGTTYRLLSYTDQQKFTSYERTFRQAVGSFQRLTDPQALAVKPARLRLVQLRAPMTLLQFQQQYPSTITIEQLALINGLDAPTTTVPAGTWVKRVVVQ